MKRILITFGSDGYEDALTRLVKSVKEEFDSVLVCGEETISELMFDFPLHFKQSKGFGWWAWKPYILKMAMENKMKEIKMEYGDQIMYVDACLDFTQSPKGLMDYFDGPITLFENGQPHYKYCKQFTYEFMGVKPDKTQVQCNGAYMLFTRNEKSLQFINEWYKNCLNLRLINDDIDDPNAEHMDFVAHRHDQSILTNLAIKHKIEINPDISQWGSKNPIINHHRTK